MLNDLETQEEHFKCLALMFSMGAPDLPTDVVGCKKLRAKQANLRDIFTRYTQIKTKQMYPWVLISNRFYIISCC